MRRGELIGVDAKTCKQANLRMFQETLNRVFKDLPNIDVAELFTVEFKGHRFNALPFLLNGACYFDGTCYGWVLQLISKEMPDVKDVSISEISRDRLINAKLFEALMPGDRGRREMYALCFMRCRSSFLRVMFHSAARALNRVVLWDGFNHLNFQYKDICNTQAFCYYMSIYWLVNLTPALRSQIEPNLRKANFIEIFEGLCPETSIHFKYICGELTVNQLIKAYNEERFDDGSSIAIREAYSLACRGNYDGSPMTKEQWSIGNEDVGLAFRGAETFMNMHLAHAYLFCGRYDDMKTKLDRAESEIKRGVMEADGVRKKYNKSADECRRLRKQNAELQSQVSQLRGEISRQDTHDELRKQIAELEAKISAVTAENNTLFNERLELKQELSRRAKEIKQLSARIREQGDEDSNLGVDTEDVPLEEMIAVLKDKRIVMVGGDRSKSMLNTFRDWGFKSVSNMSGNVRRMECDYIVVCTILCSHEDVYQAEKYIKGHDTELVFVNGVNAELIVRAVYDAYLLKPAEE